MADIHGTAIAELLNGTSTAESIDGKGGDDTLNGAAGDDTLIGGGGSDSLSGGSGNDSMAGGTGNDIYIVTQAGDVILELADAGTDTVKASVTCTLSDNLENLALTGTNAINGTGNGLNNTITGNSAANRLAGSGGNDTLSGSGGVDTLNGGAGNDSLDGGAGGDSLVGGAGNDIYVVNAGDTVVEATTGGTDTVKSATTHALADNVEKLTLTGTNAVNGTGNTGDNTLTGNSAANTLNGSTGADTLNGGGGDDTLNGGGGNDSLVGGGGADSLAGGGGDDVLEWNAADAKVDGGAGDDTLKVTGTTTLDLAGRAGSQLTSIEAVNLSGTNTLTLGAGDVTALSSTDVLRVDGGSGDALDTTGLWTNAGSSVAGYTDYTNGAATLRVQDGIDVSGVAVAAPVLELSALDGANGFRVSGESAADQSGRAVSAAGDVNGDGYDDVLIGANDAAPYAAFSGASYVVFGAASGIASNLDLTALDGTNGFRIPGEFASDSMGISVSGAGDVNGDGYADLLIGAPGGDPNGGASGASYVVFGSASGFGANLNLSTLDGDNGFQISGVAESDNSGRPVSAAGDVNGDGYADLLVGAPQADPNGSSSGAGYVVFGAASGFGASLDLSALDGANGFRIAGEAAADGAGRGIAAAGDVNGDGYADVLVGAIGVSPNGGLSGATYVVFGTGSGFAPDLGVTGLDGSNGFRIAGEAAGDRSGWSVSGAGDVNGDGYADVIIGAYLGDASVDDNAGESYVVFGTASGFGSNLELSALDGANGFRMTGESYQDYSGTSVSGAGDVNGDGYADLLIGAPRSDANGSNAGASYVVFGAASGFGSNFDLSALDGVNGLQISGAAVDDRSGSSVSAAGDVNGDGYADIVVGAYWADAYGNDAGASYVIYGRDFTGEVDFQGTSGANTLAGTAAAEIFVAGRGNDTLAGGGGADVFRGGEGDDRIVVASAGSLDIDGGSGNDTLAVGAADLNLDLTAIADGKTTGLEKIDITGFGNNTATLSSTDVLNLSDTSNTVIVTGDAGDIVNVSDGPWAASGNGSFNIYTLGAAELWVSIAVTVNVTTVT